MSYLTKDQLENYLNNLPSNKAKTNLEYNKLKNELIFPVQKPTVQDNNEMGTIQDRMRRLRASSTSSTQPPETSKPSLPETPKPIVSSKPAFTSKKPIDAFEASLMPRTYQKRPTSLKPAPPAPFVVPVAPATPPLPPSIQPMSPPPALPNSPRPARPDSYQKKASILSPVYAGLDCPGCSQPIEGSIVKAMEKVWHSHCFTCARCRQPLQDDQYFEKDDKAYCKKDYRDLFSFHCDFCHDPIEEHAIHALGKYYHEGHFCCTSCKTPFGDHNAFLVHDDKPYCQEDYLKLFGKKCGGCTDYINGEYVTALDQSWHKKCFSCTTCKVPFRDGTFLVRDNKPYCEEHYRQSINRNTGVQPPRESHHPKPSPVASRPPLPIRDNTLPKTTQPPVLKPKPAIPPKKFQPIPSEQHTFKPTPKPTEQSNLKGKVCVACNELIDGPSTSALGHDYHIHHFQCSSCERALSSRVPGMWQGNEYGQVVCKMCAFKRE